MYMQNTRMNVLVNNYTLAGGSLDGDGCTVSALATRVVVSSSISTSLGIRLVDLV